jgi:quercetin dioxygenase-like cupin family protein
MRLGRIRVGALLAALTALAVLTGGIPIAAQINPADPVRTPVMQNETLAVTHLRFGPGTREAIHTHPFPLVLVQITAGGIAVQEQNTTKRGGKVGEVWYIPTDRSHAITTLPNLANAVDLLAIALLPGRPPAPAAPATEAPPGIMRATLVDNEVMRVVRVRFAPGAREPLHAHPNDLLTIQLTPGKVDVTMGTQHQSQEREPGYVHFVPRNVDHAYANEDTKPFELISLSVK